MPGLAASINAETKALLDATGGPGNTSQLLFAAGVRNANLFCHAYDLTGLSYSALGGALVGVHTGLLAFHTGNTTQAFADSAGTTTYTGTGASQTRITGGDSPASNDTWVNALAAPMNAAITPCTIMPNNWADYLEVDPSSRSPSLKPWLCMIESATGKVCVGRVNKIGGATNHVILWEPVPGYEAWYPTDFTNISGSPVFALVNGTAVLLSEFQNVGGGPDYGGLGSQIQAATSDTIQRFNLSGFAMITTITTVGTSTWTVPAGTYSIKIYQGAPGGGADVPVTGTGGGGGGASIKNILPVTPGQVLTVINGAVGVGSPDFSTPGTDGGSSGTLYAAALITKANGGKADGTGGSTTGAVGDTKFAGGLTDTNNGEFGGGGGAGSGGAGGEANADGTTGGVGGIGVYAGGAGGVANLDDSTVATAGVAGLAGGGGGFDNVNSVGKNGGNCQTVLEFPLVTVTATAVRSGLNVVVTFSSSGAAVDHFQISNGGPFSTQTSPYTDTGAAGGIHTYTINADNSGGAVIGQGSAFYSTDPDDGANNNSLLAMGVI